MNTIKLRKHIEQNLLQISADNLKIIAEFVEFIKQKENPENINYPLPENISYKPASGQSVLRHAGQWVGDDLQDCLDLVNQTRGKVLVNRHINPFE
ncbi:hypothetical protein [Planktothrix paucivesiculata]|uniref:DUF2281 domain-containing protein n=1 Tax=Planktothrix paucivesiculata PCC 9631 TaxID=671071 RepID=A0A7Z9E5I0_9CYAN|nr:hypothetical protein [Planktothrix paucivesiculata]VXD25324.1 conserved hypothetical protein [Planktothrix paucivesiculata PCC 9631]